jgi:hypothetical protein
MHALCGRTIYGAGGAASMQAFQMQSAPGQVKSTRSRTLYDMLTLAASDQADLLTWNSLA